MGFQMNPDQFTGLFYNDPGSSIGYRKNPVTYFDVIVTDIILEPVRNFLWQESNLCLFSAFGIPDYSLPVFDILWSEFQNLTDPHATSGHEFKQQPVPWVSGPENDFVDHIFFQDLKLAWVPGSE
jgi:hypothetical protein